MFDRRIEAKTFSDNLLSSVLYSSEVKKNRNGEITIVLKGAENGKN